MGNITGRLSRPFKNWNVESRAHKIISQPKPKVAPTYASTKQAIDLVNKMEPEYKETAQKKNVHLDKNLKNVFVTSNDSQIQEVDSRTNPNRPLPKETTLPQPFEYGFYEPEVTPMGKITLRNAIDLINKRGKEPEKYTTDLLSTEYKLKPKVVDNILEYYKIYKIIDIEFNSNKDTIAKPIPISLRSGIRVPHTEKKKKSKLKIFGSKKDDEPELIKKIEDK